MNGAEKLGGEVTPPAKASGVKSFPQGTRKTEPASELMKVIARKVPLKKKILNDFTPEEAKEILGKVKADKQSAEGKVKEKAKENEPSEIERKALIESNYL